MHILDDIRACRHCAAEFALTHTRHEPRPVLRVDPRAKILIAGQAPGARVHETGVPFTDPSGDRLREWLGIGNNVFYDISKVAIVPMAFCFPGYDEKGADLPPPKICASLWRTAVMGLMPNLRLTILVGGYAQTWHLRHRLGVTETVKNLRDYAPAIYPLPHPSWRNTAWLKRNPWFEADILPALRQDVRKVLNVG